MKFVNQIKALFNKTEKIIIDEKINTFDLFISSYDCPAFKDKVIEDILSVIEEGDRFSFSIQIEENDPATIVEKRNIAAFIKDYNDNIKFFEHGEKVNLKLHIEKYNSGHKKIIYDYDAFKKFWQSIEPINLLNVLNELLVKYSFIEFETIENDIKPLSSYSISLNMPLKINASTLRTEYINENCHFGNSEKYSISPLDFYLLDRTNNDLSNKFDMFCSLFSIISIFDITSINNSSLHYKLNGYKVIQGSLEINNSLINCYKIYYDISEWCYSSKSNITDKIGLIRNILTIHIKDNDILKVDESIINSIKSSYKTYLKENVSKYIDIRNKIIEELNWISQKSSEIVKNYLSSYQKSIFTFLSFFISVFIIKILNNESFLNVFSKEATILSFAFLLLSIVYLIFSSWDLNKEKTRLKRKYENLKGRYKDLLVDEDINNILKNDEEFNYEFSFINKRHRSYTTLWLITIIVLFFAVLSISDYVNWIIIFICK